MRRPGGAAHAHQLSPDKEPFDVAAPLLSELGELMGCSAHFSPSGSTQGPLLLFLIIIVIVVIIIVTIICYYGHLPRHISLFFLPS